MTARDEYVDFVQDILDIDQYAIGFLEGMPYAVFASDIKTIFAVMQAIEMMGEAAKRVPEPVRERYPAIPWKDLAGTRDRLIHNYPMANVAILWTIVHEELPPLLPLLEQMLNEITGGEQNSSR